MHVGSVLRTIICGWCASDAVLHARAHRHWWRALSGVLATLKDSGCH